MDKQELMNMAANKAINELDWDSIEFLFKPTNVGALLLRHDFKGMTQKVNEAFEDDSPTAMPHRFRPPFAAEWIRAIEFEEFYRKLKALHEIKENLI